MGMLTQVASRLRQLAKSQTAPRPPSGAGSAIARIDDVRNLLVTGRLHEAGSVCQQVLAEHPDSAEAAYQLGLIRFQEGDLAAAVVMMERATTLGWDAPQLKVNLGLAYLHLDRLDDADNVLSKARENYPTYAAAPATLALVKVRKRDVHGAAAHLNTACELEPCNVEYLNNLGGVLREIGKLDDALERFRRALELRPGDAAIWTNLGGCQSAARQWTGAAESFRAAIVRDQTSVVAWTGLGVVALELGDAASAESACRKAVAFGPDRPEAWGALGGVLLQQDRLDEAESALRKSLELAPRRSEAWGQLARICEARLAFDEAEAAYRGAIDADPASAAARLDLAHHLLGQGKYEEGLELFESRFAATPGWFTDDLREIGCSTDEHRWRGQPIAGKHVLVVGEQGLGDQIMMFRYLPLLKQRGASRVSLTCSPQLLRIAERLPGVDAVFARTDPARPMSADLVAPILSLPYCFRSTPATLPDAGYLAIDYRKRGTSDTASFGTRAPRIGLVWAGSSTQDDAARRTLTLQTMSPLLGVPGTEFVSLQMAADDALPCAAWEGRLTSPVDSRFDFFDTAAVMVDLDLVISVDTAIAHLAGTLGLPTWLIVKAGGEWRWGPTCADSPWYRSIQIFRQCRGESWDSVVERIKDALVASMVDAVRRMPRAPSSEIHR